MRLWYVLHTVNLYRKKLGRQERVSSLVTGGSVVVDSKSTRVAHYRVGMEGRSLRRRARLETNRIRYPGNMVKDRERVIVKPSEVQINCHESVWSTHA